MGRVWAGGGGGCGRCCDTGRGVGRGCGGKGLTAVGRGVGWGRVGEQFRKGAAGACRKG